MGWHGTSLAYRIDPRDILRGRLTLKWSDGQATSAGSFVFGWKRSVLLTHAAGREGRPERPRDGAAPDFFAKMCDYLLARLPRYRREGGRYLVSEDGARIDLLGPDPLMPMAEAVASRIEGEADQIAACCAGAVPGGGADQQRDVVGGGARGNPGSVLWTRGTFCDTYSMMVAELIERVMAVQGRSVKTGLVYMLRPEGASWEWPNHFWGGVWLGHGVAIADAEAREVLLQAGRQDVGDAGRHVRGPVAGGGERDRAGGLLSAAQAGGRGDTVFPAVAGGAANVNGRGQVKVAGDSQRQQRQLRQRDPPGRHGERRRESATDGRGRHGKMRMDGHNGGVWIRSV